MSEAKNVETSPTTAGSEVERIVMLKLSMGIENANCDTCRSLGSDGDGYEYNGTWPVCDKFENYMYLKSFPFKKDMKCWEPNFWCSKFTEMIVNGTDEEMTKAIDAFKLANEA